MLGRTFQKIIISGWSKANCLPVDQIDSWNPMIEINSIKVQTKFVNKNGMGCSQVVPNTANGQTIWSTYLKVNNISLTVSKIKITLFSYDKWRVEIRSPSPDLVR